MTEQSKQPTTVRIVGLGGAGGRIAAALAARADGEPTVALVNCDARELEDTPAALKLQIGRVQTAGAGAGGAPETGRLAMVEDAELARGLFEHADLVLLVVGLGGGCAGGAALLAQIARDDRLPVVILATLPFAFEGRERRMQAEAQLKSLCEACEGVIVIENERLAALVEAHRWTECLPAVNRVLGDATLGLWGLLARPGYISLGLPELRNRLRQAAPYCALAYGEAAGPNRAVRAVEQLLESPLVDQGRAWPGVRSALVCVAGGDDLTLGEISVMMGRIENRLAHAGLAMGTTLAPAWNGRVAVTILLAEQVRATETPSEPEKTGGRRGGRGGDRASRARKDQIEISFDQNRGRFAGTEPNLLDGEDLDVPTYIRRRLTIEA